MVTSLATFLDKLEDDGRKKKKAEWENKEEKWR